MRWGGACVGYGKERCGQNRGWQEEISEGEGEGDSETGKGGGAGSL